MRLDEEMSGATYAERLASLMLLPTSGKMKDTCSEVL
jgi:hypothetical protein